ncbi:hypothetical protein CsSME_00011033 [Camellia sinensis var. sinensis]
MSGSSNLFSEYTPSSGQEKVRIADSTISSVSGKGLIHATSSLLLSSIFHVPNFSDLIMRKRIGSGREDHGLNILDQTDKLAHSSI